MLPRITAPLSIPRLRVHRHIMWHLAFDVFEGHSPASRSDSSLVSSISPSAINNVVRILLLKTVREFAFNFLMTHLEGLLRGLPTSTFPTWLVPRFAQDEGLALISVSGKQIASQDDLAHSGVNQLADWAGGQCHLVAVNLT